MHEPYKGLSLSPGPERVSLGVRPGPMYMARTLGEHSTRPYAVFHERCARVVPAPPSARARVCCGYLLVVVVVVALMRVIVVVAAAAVFLVLFLLFLPSAGKQVAVIHITRHIIYMLVLSLANRSPPSTVSAAWRAGAPWKNDRSGFRRQQAHQTATRAQGSLLQHGGNQRELEPFSTSCSSVHARRGARRGLTEWKTTADWPGDCAV